MPNIKHLISIYAPTNKVYDAITTSEHLLPDIFKKAIQTSDQIIIYCLRHVLAIRAPRHSRLRGNSALFQFLMLLDAGSGPAWQP